MRELLVLYNLSEARQVDDLSHCVVWDLSQISPLSDSWLVSSRDMKRRLISPLGPNYTSINDFGYLW